MLFFLDRRKQAKMQWLQHPNHSHVRRYPNNVRREASTHYRNKKEEYLKAKIGEFETNGKIKNISDLCRGINYFKKRYQPRTNIVWTYTIVWDEKGDLVTDSQSIFARCRNHFSRLFNVYKVNAVRQTEIQQNR